MFTLKFLEYNQNPFVDQKDYIILDIDHTLVCTFSDKHLKTLERVIKNSNYDLSDIVYKIPEVREGNKQQLFVYGVKRPYLDVFLKFCHCYYKGVIVWSAGDDYYVDKMVAELFKNLPKPLLTLRRSDCELKDGNYYKPIDKLFDLVGDMDYSNTIVLDDTPSTYCDNPYNAVDVPAYTVQPTISSISGVDTVLLQIMWWLLSSDTLASVDVTSLEKPQLL